MHTISLKRLKVFVKGVSHSPACVVVMHKGKMEHPVSEAQRRWAWAAENKGELPEGTAHRWSKRVEGEDLPEHTEDGKPVKKKKKPRLVVKATGATISAAGRIRDRDADPRLPYSPMTANERTVYEDREKELAGKGEKDPKKKRPPRRSRDIGNQPHTTIQDQMLATKR